MKDILITSSVLITAILLLRFLFRSTISRRTQYALWLLVALRLLIPASIGSSSWSVASITDKLPERETTESIVTVVGGDIPQLAPREPDPTLPEAMRQEMYREYQREWKDEVDRVKVETGGTPITVQGILRAAWYSGMAVMALWFLAANLRFARKLRRTRVPLDGTESKYPVYLCDDIPSPCLFGLLRSAIYVTSEAAKDENRLRYVIAHEETHARHLDPLWSFVRSVCLVIWWFNPLVWLAAHFSKADCELACDEGTLVRLGESARVSYGETLLALIPVRRGGNPMLTATTMTAGKRQMKERIRRIAEHKRPLAAALVVVLALTGVACAATFTGARQASAEPSDTAEQNTTGAYASVEDYLAAVRAETTSVTYSAADGSGERTADVSDTRAFLEMEAELSGLAPNGTLELYSYMKELKLEVPPEDVAFVGGMYATDELWYDLEGQGGHSLVVLRYDDGSVDVLFDQPNNDDRGGLYYYEESAEEILYDFYVKENGLDLPLYTTDLTVGGNSIPAHRRDSDGWYIYIPVQGWSEASSGGTARWISAYNTGSTISVTFVTDEEREQLRQDVEGRTETYYSSGSGTGWLVVTQYDPSVQIRSDVAGLEPAILEAMARSINLASGSTVQVKIKQTTQNEADTVSWQLRAAADAVFGTVDSEGLGPFFLRMTADGRTDEYTVEPEPVQNVEFATGNVLETAFVWSPLSDSQITAAQAADRVLHIWNEQESFDVYGDDILHWTERESGAEHWLRGSSKLDWIGSLYGYFLEQYARPAELDRPLREIAVPGTVTDYEEVARQVAEQFAAIMRQHPKWCDFSPYDAAVNRTRIFDAYYGEDYPNFCFGMGLVLKLDESNKLYFEAGAGLDDPIADGQYKGWYSWGGEVVVGLRDGVWRYLGMNTGGSSVWLPYDIGYDYPQEYPLTTGQVLSLYELTGGDTHDFRLLQMLAQKPTDEIRAEMAKLTAAQRRELLDSMAQYNADYGGLGSNGSFTLSEFE